MREAFGLKIVLTIFLMNSATNGQNLPQPSPVETFLRISQQDCSAYPDRKSSMSLSLHHPHICKRQLRLTEIVLTLTLLGLTSLKLPYKLPKPKSLGSRANQFGSME
jgi:hypothetical protein